MLVPFLFLIDPHMLFNVLIVFKLKVSFLSGKIFMSYPKDLPNVIYKYLAISSSFRFIGILFIISNNYNSASLNISYDTYI